jgi:hypothetical protein
MSSIDEDKQPKLPIIILDVLQNDPNSQSHPELMTMPLPLGKSAANIGVANAATRKINAKNVDLNENTDGFITQINVDADASKTTKQNNLYNIQTLDPQLLIPDENSMNKKATHHHHHANNNFMRLHSSSTNNNSVTAIEHQSHSKKETSFIDLNLSLNNNNQHENHFLTNATRLNTKIDFNDTTLSDEYYEDLNYSSSTNKKPNKNHPSAPPHNQLNKSKTDLNSISETGALNNNNTSNNKGTGGGSIFSFFPNIPGKSLVSNTASKTKYESKTKFPVHRNFFDRNIYVQYLTGKLEKPIHSVDNNNYTASLIRIHQQQNLLPKSFTRLERRHQHSKSFTSSYRTRTTLSDSIQHESASAMESSSGIVDKQVFVDFKGIKSPPPSQLGKPMPTKIPTTAAKPLKTQKTPTRSVNPRFRNYDKVFRKDNAFLGRKGFISHSFSNNRESTKMTQPSQTTSYSTMTHAKPFKKIIDLNQLNNDSKLASHYLAYQSASHLSELKLHDVWPNSKMYKVTIKSNPWVDKYKSISYAHEVNDSFRHFKPSNKLPNIKTQVY